MPPALLIPWCITVTALKFPEHAKLHLCMAGSPSVLIGLSSPVLRSHQYLFGVEAFLRLGLFTQLDLVGNLREEAQCIFRNVGLFTSVGLLFLPRNVRGVKWSIEPAMLRQVEIKLGKI